MNAHHPPDLPVAEHLARARERQDACEQEPDSYSAPDHTPNSVAKPARTQQDT